MADNLKQIPGLPNYYLTSEGNAVKQEPSWWDKVKSYGKAALDVINEEAPYFIPGIATYKFAEDAGNNFNTAILQVKDGDYNAIANTATGLGNTLMGVVSLAPFIGGGVKVATKLANNFNRALKAARTQIVAKAFDNLVKSTTPKITVPEVSPIIYTPTTNTSKTSLAFLERPSKLTLREKIGAPKGTKVYTPEENVAFRQLINDFALKYGYEPIGLETTDPEVLERYARSLIKRHNTFYRGVNLPSKSTEQWALLENALGKNFTEQQALKYMATNPPGGGAGEVYLSPFSNTAGFYGNLVEVTRPFKLGTDRTKWFEEGDFPLVDNQGHRDLKFYKDFKGLTDPWNSGYLGKTKVSNLSKEDVLSLYKLSDYVSSSENIPNEITARNQLLIPQRITYLTKPGSKDWTTPDITFTGSRKIADTPWQFTNITPDNFKSGLDVKPSKTVRLYRATGTNGNFEGSLDGGQGFVGQWFTNNPTKPQQYASMTVKRAKRAGVNNPIELQYVDIPESELNKYKASEILKGRTDIEYEPTEDFLIPLDYPRLRVPLEGYTGNLLMDARRSLPELSVKTITPENAATITPEQWTAAQDAAVARGDMTEAQRLRDLHASVNGYNPSLSLYHGSPKAFNLFEAIPNSAGYVDYHSHFSTNPATALTFGNVRRFYTNVKTPLRVTDQGAIWEPLNLARELGIQPKGGRYPLEPYWREFQNLKGRNMYKEANRKFMELELKGDAYIYDNVVEGGGDSYAIPTSRQVKLSDAVTYDNNGIRIPLGKRDNFNINDIRYGLVPWFLSGTTAGYLYNKSLDTYKPTEVL